MSHFVKEKPRYSEIVYQKVQLRLENSEDTL